VKNKEIAALFDRIADALEIKGELDFKVGAYRRAARAVEDLTEDVAVLAAENRLESIPGVGRGLADKIREYLETGRMAKYEEAFQGIPETLLELLEVQGLGGKTIRLMNRELGVKGLDDLKRVIEDGSLAALKGMGEKKVENIKKGVAAHERYTSRISIYEAVILADALTEFVRGIPGVVEASPAGSVRRMKETVGDIDILAAGKNGGRVIRAFIRFPGTTRVLAEGETKGSIIANVEGIERQVDLRVVDAAEYGAALLYFTGSKAHNIKLRGLAKDMGLKVSEYGIFRGEKRVAGRTEEDCYRALGMVWIPPEMREDRGEVELALEDKLPRLVEGKDIKGDLHVHSRASDGTMTLEEIAALGRKRGYSYIAVCDHSVSAGYAGGLSVERLLEQGREIDRLNGRLKGFRLLKGVEVDILADGRLDFPDKVLAGLDFVVAAVHSGFKKNVTERVAKACANPHVRVIAHPTGRLISGREGYEVDIDRVIEAAARGGKALELNAYYDRLDLDEHNLKKAREHGVRISIGTDTHHPEGLSMMRFGVAVARRAWLGTSDILNCLSAESLTGRAGAKKPGGKRRLNPS
jgi:DNA polymerase (family 10)